MLYQKQPTQTRRQKTLSIYTLSTAKHCMIIIIKSANTSVHHQLNPTNNRALVRFNFQKKRREKSNVMECGRKKITCCTFISTHFFMMCLMEVEQQQKMNMNSYSLFFSQFIYSKQVKSRHVACIIDITFFPCAPSLFSCWFL